VRGLFFNGLFQLYFPFDISSCPSIPLFRSMQKKFKAKELFASFCEPVVLRVGRACVCICNAGVYNCELGFREPLPEAGKSKAA
jgi:hypothetical protein